MSDELSKIVDSDGNHMLVKYADGYPFPSFEKLTQNLAEFKQWTPKPQDVFLFAYPASGTHWLWEVTCMLMVGKAERLQLEKEHYMVENSGTEILDKLKEPRVINAHVYIEQVPECLLENNKIIMISRNPKDTAVSWYNHNVADLETDYTGKFPAFYELFRVGNVPNGDWFNYNQTWWQWSKGRPNVLWVTYEDAKSNLKEVIRKIANFLEVPVTDELSEAIAHQCDFKKMKAEKHSLLPFEMRGNMSFYRKGQVGDWKNWFTVAQNEDFDQIWNEKMKDCDLPVQFTI
ncbi:sulfotransferase family cytosolic 1B member 1-like [Argonauta hians]